MLAGFVGITERRRGRRARKSEDFSLLLFLFFFQFFLFFLLFVCYPLSLFNLLLKGSELGDLDLIIFAFKNMHRNQEASLKIIAIGFLLLNICLNYLKKRNCRKSHRNWVFFFLLLSSVKRYFLSWIHISPFKRSNIVYLIMVVKKSCSPKLRT